MSNAYPQSPAADEELLRAKLNMETALINWLELQRHFAAGRVLAVAPELDLVEVALRVCLDVAPVVEDWLARKAVAAVSVEQAQAWCEGPCWLWAVVVSPWVLVQERVGHPEEYP